ncbi:cytochrome C oxidase subunit IV family protein [Rhodoferax sp. GW822-FHT02A01]|uniref:cytochrome C oxidase subunit IV family protein n=1 Tax=Rhodoferax sp. GW822-FHT02A01 TaxID=3141537 RepID=UPI00315D7AE8
MAHPDNTTTAALQRAPAQHLPAVWSALLLLTLLSYYGLSRFSEGTFVPLVLAAMWLKGQLLVDQFMGLRQVRRFWRALMALYLLGVTVAIGLAFLLD